jgi:Arc/MetJ-type ribon-helix-helix transcriptional regulator
LVRRRKAVGIVSKQLDDREYSPSTGAAYPRNRWYLDLLRDPDDIDEDDREDDDDDDDVEKQTDHHASVVANLLVESGRFGSRSEALHHLLHKPGGRALLASLHKAAETAKESTMKTQELRDIAKGGIHAIAKAMTDENRGYGITEHEFVDLIGKHDPRPGESEAQTFTRHYTAQTADSLMLRKAHALTKGVANLTPTMVGGPDAMREAVDNTEQSEAYAKLESMAERMRATSPWLSAAQAFSAVFQEPKNAKLAASAHRRPSAASTSYPFPSVR